MALDYEIDARLSSGPGTPSFDSRASMLRNEIGGRVRNARLARALTQRELARQAGVSHQLISQIENGIVNTTLDTLDAIWNTLDLDGTLDPSGSRAPVAERFAAVLPHIPDEELEVFLHELALWERRYGRQDRAKRGG